MIARPPGIPCAAFRKRGVRWSRSRSFRSWPSPPRAVACGQSAVEFCVAALVLLALACPCVEAARMSADALAAESAAADIARAVASTGPSFDERAFLSQAYPGIANASANVSWKTPTLEPYQHRLVKEDGTVLVRDSIASSQRIVARVIVERAFITPIAAMFGSFSGTRGYTVEGTGIALRDTTAQSGRW